ncbi:MAG: thioesterase family protein [Rhodococcus sp. (in: high G+C Gram-positive bacteria)]
MLITLRMLRQMAPWRGRGGPVRADFTRTYFRVAPSDLDVLLHMNNGRYLSILDSGRVDMFVRGGVWRALRGRGWHPVVASQTITYTRSLTFWTKFSVTTRFLGLDTKNAYLEQTFESDHGVHASAVVALRFLDSSGHSVPTDRFVAIFDAQHAPKRLPDVDVPLGRRTQFEIVNAFDDTESLNAN